MRTKITLTVTFFYLVFNISGQYIIPEEILCSSALLELKTSNGPEYGSGFFFKTHKKCYLITAKHVLFNDIITRDNNKNYILKSDFLTVKYYPRNPDQQQPNNLEIKLHSLLEDSLLKYNDVDDITVMELADIEISEDSTFYWTVYHKNYVNKTSEESSRLEAFNINDIINYDEAIIGRDVFIFGYPKSLGLKQSRQFDFNRPLVRAGIVAGLNSNNRTIIIDCPAYGGNSGGPVMQIIQEEDYVIGKLLGIVVSFIPYEELWYNPNYKILNHEIANSGYSVVEPMDNILMLLESFK